MHRSSPRRVLFASLVSLGLMTGLSALPAPVHAQVNQRTYAPENLSQLSMADQTRVISLEYREQSSGSAIPDDQLRFYLDQVRLSSWTFSRIKADIAQSLGDADGDWSPPAPVPVPEPGPGPANAIRCESNDGRPRTCTTQWQGQSRLLRQLSSTACVQGRSWFTSRGQVTVSNGCRGEFGPGVGNGAGGRDTVSVRCESSDGGLRACGTELYGRVELQRQLSNTACVQGSNFGLRNGSVWVDRGCRGDFLVRLRPDRPVDEGYSVTCSSVNSRYTTCAWNSRRGQPYLIERLSKQACTNGYSWGYSARTGLWVNHGCRARFGTR